MDGLIPVNNPVEGYFDGEKMYCGIDVSKNKSNVCLLDEDRNKIKEFEIEHTKEGFERLRRNIAEGTKIALEVTGNYSKVVYNNLKEDYDMIYVDGVQMNNIAKYHSPTIKNDKVDAELLAKALCFPDLIRVNPLRVNELRDLSKLYQKIKKQVVMYKSMFRDQINIIFPELESLMTSADNLGIASLLIQYPNPSEISKLCPEEILRAMTKDMKKGSGNFKIERAVKIKNLADNSVGDSSYPVAYFKYTIDTMLYLLKLKKEIKKSLEEALSQTPYYSLMDRFGLNVVSLSMIVGEIGDIRRFANYKKFVSYCGFGIYEKKSGTSVNKSSRLSKRGNKLLRFTFYALTLTQLRKRNEISNHYNKLKERGKHPKKCLIASARKLAVKTYYDMLQCHEST